MFRIKDIRKKLFMMGIDITSEQIRSYEHKGLFGSTRNKVGYRQYSDTQVGDIITAIILYKIGYSVEEININKKHLLCLLGKAVKELS